MNWRISEEEEQEQLLGGCENRKKLRNAKGLQYLLVFRMIRRFFLSEIHQIIKNLHS